MLIALIMSVVFAQAQTRDAHSALPSKLPAKVLAKHQRASAVNGVAAPTPVPTAVPTPVQSATPLPEGKVQETYPSGKPHFIRDYKDGQLLSEVSFTETGALQTKKLYEQGHQTSDDTFYENGSLQKSIRRTPGPNGEVEIKIQTFFENGKPAVSGAALSNSFTDAGVPEGPYQTWNEKGAVLQTGQYHLGAKIGIWKLNLENAFRTEIYDAGRLLRRIDIDVRTKKTIADDRFTEDGALEMPVPPKPLSSPSPKPSSSPKAAPATGS